VSDWLDDLKGFGKQLWDTAVGDGQTQIDEEASESFRIQCMREQGLDPFDEDDIKEFVKQQDDAMDDRGIFS